MASKTLRVVPVVLVLMGVLFAGCLGADEQDLPTLTAAEEATVNATSWAFDDAWGLTEGLPTGETSFQALGDFYSRWAVGSGFPQWTSAPLDRAIVVDGPVVLDFWVTAESATTSTPGIFPDFVVYFGTTDSVLSVVSPTNLKPVVADFSVITADDAVLVHAEFAVPPGGITVPAGAGLRVVTAPVMMESDAADLEVLYGSADFPSGVAFSYHNSSELVSTWTDRHEHSGDHVLAAGTFLHGVEVEDTNIYVETVEITQSHRALLVDLDFTGSTPFPDMDLYVLAPDGSEVALSVTPGADEAVHLYSANLAAVGPGTWSIKVINYVTVQAAFTLSVVVLGESHGNDDHDEDAEDHEDEASEAGGKPQGAASRGYALA